MNGYMSLRMGPCAEFVSWYLWCPCAFVVFRMNGLLDGERRLG